MMTEAAMCRQPIRLPAPPAKRQKRAVQPLHVQPDTARRLADTPSSTLQPEVAAEPEAPEALLSDTLAALHLLKSRFPAEVKVTPFATKAQLYSVLSDRTTVDRQLDELRRTNTVRLLQLPVSKDEYAVMLTEDYLSALQTCKQQLQQKASTQAAEGQPKPAASAAPTAATALLAVFDWFATRVLPACTEVMITQAELVPLLARAPSAGGSSRAADRVTDQHLSLLLNQCFLTRHTGGLDGYLFSMPNAGTAVRSVAAGRQEILSLLQRRRHPELLESELEKRKLQRSVLGIKWHVADMLGCGALLRISTTVGPLLRVAKRGG